jgi:hypothetical protein
MWRIFQYLEDQRQDLSLLSLSRNLWPIKLVLQQDNSDNIKPCINPTPNLQYQANFAVLNFHTS